MWNIMTRVILAPNDLMTPFDLRAQNFRVNLKLSLHYRGQKFFFEKMSEILFAISHDFSSISRTTLIMTFFSKTLQISNWSGHRNWYIF